MNPVPDRAMFQDLYAGSPPWDVGKPQKPFVEIAGRIIGPVLDAGCGSGDLALYLAGRGCEVTGIDFLQEPIERAKNKAAEKTTSAAFLVKDALTMSEWAKRFDNVTDCGLFHVFADDDRGRYVEGLATVLKPGGRLFLLCFSDAEPGTQGPRRVSRKELYDAFANGWVIESVEPTRFEVRPELKGMTFSDGGPKAWFLVARRAEER